MIHPTAEADAGCRIGKGCTLWHQAQVRAGAVLGAGCVLGKGAYVDAKVVLGRECRVQNYGCVFGPAEVGNRVLIGPHAVVSNCRFPRVNLGNCYAGHIDAPVRIDHDASIGAHAVILPGVHVGAYATIGSGAVVTRDVPAYALAYGVPACVVGKVCRCGRPTDHIPCTRCARRRLRVRGG